MRDDLRSLNLLPTASPYASAPATASVFAVTGNDALVDWVLVEVRQPTTPTLVIASQAAFVQRDGDVVAVDGVSPVSFSGVSAGNYDVALKHRNHLGVMTASPVSLAVGGTALLDFTAPATPVYGSNAMRLVGSVRVLWAGNANGDKSVIYAGGGNDLNPILLTVFSDPGNSALNRNYVVTGYKASDLNLDGRTIAAGANSDVTTLLLSLFVYPGNTTLSANYIIQEQLP